MKKEDKKRSKIFARAGPGFFLYVKAPGCGVNRAPGRLSAEVCPVKKKPWREAREALGL